MKMGWTDQETKAAKEVTAPLSLVVTAVAAVRDTRKTWTPALQRHSDVGETVLLIVDLAEGHKAMGGSAIAQVFNQIGNDAPNVRKCVSPDVLHTSYPIVGGAKRVLRTITPKLAWISFTEHSLQSKTDSRVTMLT